MRRSFQKPKYSREKWLRRISAAILIAGMVFTCTPAGQHFWNLACRDSGFNDYTDQRGLAEVHILDVGKADAILLVSRGHAALLDAGTASSGEKIVDYLARYGVKALDYAIMSHPDKDHIGGMSRVLEEIPVSAFVQGPMPEDLLPDSDEFKSMEAAIAASGLEKQTLLPGGSLRVGAVQLTAVGPLREYGDTNNNSLVLRLKCGRFTALFCGDMEKEAEKDVLASGQDLSAILLKVAHHGSNTSTTQDFLNAVGPDIAVVSVASDRNRLPREPVLRRLGEVWAEIYRTDTDGSLVFSYDGRRLLIDTEK